eukprot:SAG25_NODE_237_length_11266_cov_6.061789_3_plen_543_part_00
MRGTAPACCSARQRRLGRHTSNTTMTMSLPAHPFPDDRDRRGAMTPANTFAPPRSDVAVSMCPLPEPPPCGKQHQDGAGTQGAPRMPLLLGALELTAGADAGAGANVPECFGLGSRRVTAPYILKPTPLRGISPRPNATAVSPPPPSPPKPLLLPAAAGMVPRGVLAALPPPVLPSSPAVAYTPRKGATSSFRGVSWRKTAGNWRADITVLSQRKFLGVFEDEEEAARTYDKAAARFHGANAVLNFKAPKAKVPVPDARERDPLTVITDTPVQRGKMRRASKGEEPQTPRMVRAPSKQTSGYFGVRPRKLNDGVVKWEAEISICRERTIIGRFDTEEEAAHAWDAEAVKLRGAKTPRNFPAEPGSAEAPPTLRSVEDPLTSGAPLPAISPLTLEPPLKKQRVKKQRVKKKQLPKQPQPQPQPLPPQPKQPLSPAVMNHTASRAGTAQVPRSQKEGIAARAARLAREVAARAASINEQVHAEQQAKAVSAAAAKAAAVALKPMAVCDVGMQLLAGAAATESTRLQCLSPLGGGGGGGGKRSPR